MGWFDTPEKKFIKAPVIDVVGDVVPMGVLDQVRWERDVAIEQLEDHGIPFGGIAPDVVKVVRCKDCKHRRIDEDYASGHYCVKRPSNGGYFCEDNDFCSYGERRTDHA